MSNTTPIANRPQAGDRAANQYGTYQVIPASERQVAFLRQLLGRKDLAAATPVQRPDIEAARDMLDVDSISKRVATTAIDHLLTLPDSKTPAAGTGPKPASDKQVALIRRLLAEREVDPAVRADDPESLSSRGASALIDILFASPKRQAQEPAGELEAGIYLKSDGEILKIYRAVHGSGRMCAKRFVPPTEEGGKAGFEYLGLATRFVGDAHRMTLEEARRFGAIYGVCVNCGATLTDETSIERGMGPVCAGYFAA